MTQPNIKLDSEALRAHARMIDEAAAMCGEATSKKAYCWGQGLLGNGGNVIATKPVAVRGGLLFAQLRQRGVGVLLSLSSRVGLALAMAGKSFDRPCHRGDSTQKLMARETRRAVP